MQNDPITAHPRVIEDLKAEGVSVKLAEDTPEPVVYEQPNYPYYRTLPDGKRVEITRAEYKAAMRTEFTVKNNVNPMCGHRVTVGSVPSHHNCEACWFAYFQVHGEVTKLADEIFQQHGKKEAEAIITQIKGRKFFRNFLKFMSTVAKLKADIESAKEQDEQRSTSSSEGVDSEAGGDPASLQGGGAEEGS